MHKSTKRAGNSATLGDVAPSPLLCQPSLILRVSERSETGVSRHSYVLNALVDRLVDKVDFAPWTSTVGASSSFIRSSPPGGAARAPLYTPEERRRRDASPWTTVQGVLAPVQFGVFLVSLGLVVSLPVDRRGLGRGDRLDRRQDARPLRDHDHRLDLGTCGLRPVSVRPRLLLGGRGQHAACWRCTPPISCALAFGARRPDPDDDRAAGLCHLRHQRHAVPAEAARRAPASRVPACRRGPANDARCRPDRSCAGCRATGAGAARARPARGVLRPDRHHLAASQDPGRLLPRRRLAHLRPPDPVGGRRDDLRRAALRDRHHRRARPRGPRRRERRARPRRRAAARAPSRHHACCSSSARARRKSSSSICRAPRRGSHAPSRPRCGS